MRKFTLTGAGCSGKSTIVHRIAKQFPDSVIIIPEIVQVLAESTLAFPISRTQAQEYRKEYIAMIIHMQSQLESFLSLAYKNNREALVCDRGILDTIAYHPNPMNWFFEHQSSLPAELARYDTIIQLEICEKEYRLPDNPRPYPLEKAFEHQNILKKYYGYHEDYHFIPEYATIEEKYEHVLEVLRQHISL